MKGPHGGLVLNIKIGKTVIFALPDGQQILITPIDTEGSYARIAIKAPEEIKIHREGWQSSREDRQSRP